MLPIYCASMIFRALKQDSKQFYAILCHRDNEDSIDIKKKKYNDYYKNSSQKLTKDLITVCEDVKLVTLCDHF